MPGKFDHLKREELAEVRLKYNPHVHSESLRIASIVNTKTGEKQADIRKWVDSNLGKKPFKGLTQQGFRLNREQYIEFRKHLDAVDEFFRLTKKEKE